MTRARVHGEAIPPAGLRPVDSRPIAGRRSRPFRSEGRMVLSAAALIGCLTLVAKGASFARDLVLAGTMGTSDSLDAFLIAAVIPAIVVNVVAGSFNAAVIPTFIRVRDVEGTGAAQRLVAEVQLVSLGLLSALAGLLAILTPRLLPLLASGFGPEKMALTCRLSFLLLPSIPLSGAATIWSAVLNAGGKFTLAALAPAAVPLVSVLALLVGRSGDPVYALCIGLVSGVLLQAGLVGWGLVRQGLSILPGWHGGGPALRRVVGQYLPLIVGSMLMNGTVLVDQSMAARLGPGSVAALSYGNKVVALLLGLVSGAMGTAVLPYFSRRVAAGDWSGLRAALRSQAALILAVTVPSTLLLVAFSPAVVRLLFCRGTFTEQDVSTVGGIQMMYALQIPFYTLGMLFVRLISAMGLNKILMYGTAVSFLLNIPLDLVLMHHLGPRGIALASSAIYLISFAYLYACTEAVLRDRTRPCG